MQARDVGDDVHASGQRAPHARAHGVDVRWGMHAGRARAGGSCRLATWVTTYMRVADARRTHGLTGSTCAGACMLAGRTWGRACGSTRAARTGSTRIDACGVVHATWGGVMAHALCTQNPACKIGREGGLVCRGSMRTHRFPPWNVVDNAWGG